MDLLCIPQTRDQLAATEIARQGVIFQNAASAIAWINDDSEWTSLHCTARWVSLVYMHRFTDYMHCYEGRLRPEMMHQSFLDSRGVFLTDSLFCGPVTKTHPGTTSLWTLQEVCLRPDMALCNRHWQPLLAGDNTIISLDTLIVLATFLSRDVVRTKSEQLRSATGSWETILRPPPTYARNRQELAEAISDLWHRKVPHVKVFLGKVESSLLWRARALSALDVLAIGQRREVSGKGPVRRAEAIMSAVGATSWYKKRVHNGIGGQPYVLFEFYPLSFIQELASRYPLAFYGWFDPSLSYLKGAVSLGNPPRLMSRKFVGSMMPIKPGVLEVPVVLTLFRSDIDAHLTARDWTVRGDGSVAIKRVACVVFAENSSDSEVEPALQWIAVPQPARGENLHYDTDIEVQGGASLKRWLRTFCPRSRNHAVCLSKARATPTSDLENAIHGMMPTLGSGAKCPFIFSGVLLKEIDYRHGVTILVKIGCFAIPDSPNSSLVEMEVDWTVV